MSRYSTLKTIFIVQIFVGLFNGILTYKYVFKPISLGEKRVFFETEGGSVSEGQTAPPFRRQQSETSMDPDIAITFVDSGIMRDVVLKIVRDDYLIGPRTTGIWFASHNPNAYHNVSYIPRPDIFTGIKDFQFYQNKDEDAAITIFKSPGNYDVLFGRIGHYTLKTMEHKLKKKLQRCLRESDAKTDSTNITENNDDDSVTIVVIFKTPPISQVFPTLFRNVHRTKRHLKTMDFPAVVYPKFLISVDYYISAESFVRELIAYLNIADMVYRKIEKPQIRLVITGIILSQDELATPYVVQDETAAKIDGDETITMTAKYFDQDSRFPKDTYDIVVNMVTKVIWTRQWKDNLGLAYRRGACNKTSNVAVVNYRDNYNCVLQFVHEIGHLFGAEHFGQNDSNCLMVQKVNDDTGLCWPKQTLEYIEFFFEPHVQHEQDVCTKGMQKPPRKVLDSVKSMQGTWLSVDGQCHNKINDLKRVTSVSLPLSAAQLLGNQENDDCLKHFCDNGKGSNVYTETMIGTPKEDWQLCIDGKWKPLIPLCVEPPLPPPLKPPLPLCVEPPLPPRLEPPLPLCEEPPLPSRLKRQLPLCPEPPLPSRLKRPFPSCPV